VSASIIRLSDYRRRPVCPASESVAAFRLAVLRSERVAAELEALEREIEAAIKNNPRPVK